ncbi:MAG: outer membrane beta-barrel protein [Verrucomicrobia bacterium]|nr:outer membrane beta-barrel protein [Verrucomicrobiota bacterium]
METKLAVSDSEEAGFLLPGGLGYAPLDFTPGQGRFDRKPLTYSTTVQLGYDDNINSTSGSRLQAPVKGSMLTTASEGVDLLLAQSRMGLSLGATAGGQYYWQRDSDKLTPLGSLNLVFGYKLTPRAQISALMNALYTTQPTQSVVNGFTRSNGKGYLVGSSKFDLLYSWAPRFSTDTFYSLNGTAQQAQELKSNDYTNQTVGQAFRYSLSQLVTGVFEGRYSQLTYRNIPSAFPSRDSDSYFLLAGADMTLTRRFFGSFRLGGSVRDYKAPDEGSSSSPYWESSLSYLASRFTTLNWDTRYGFDDGSSTSQKSRSVRTGVSLSHVFTPKLRGSIGVNYAHVSPEGGSDAFNVKKDDLNATIGGVYALSQCMTVFANVTHSRRSSPDPLQEMTKNIYYLGATYQY